MTLGDKKASHLSLLLAALISFVLLFHSMRTIPLLFLFRFSTI